MSNEYYTYEGDLVPFTPARSRALDEEFAKIEQGFDKLSAPGAVNTGATLLGTETGGVADDYVIEIGDGVTDTILNGQMLTFFPGADNTGPSTISYNGGTNRPIVRNDGSPLGAGDLKAGLPVLMIYDNANSRWVLIGATDAQTRASNRPKVLTDATATRTLTDTDEAAVIRFTNTGTITVTLPADSDENLPVGYLVHLYLIGTGSLDVVAAAGATASFAIGNSPRTRYSSLTVVKTAANEWLVLGDAGA
jgi:hypothetical protein